MTKAQKTLWNCQSCRCKTPRSDNTNTPIRPQQFPSSSVNKPSTEPLRQNTVSSNKSDTENFDDESIVDNTQTPNENLKNDNISLQILDRMLDDKIVSLKNYFANDITRIISEEISKFMIGLKSETMEKTEEYLHYRISTMIQEICGINITGYVEEITRIGRKGHRRPVVPVEFLSKRLPKHLLQNHQLFQNTGISISEYLDKETFLKRKKLSQILTEARRNGHHAVIRNNKLLIDGKEVNKSQKENLYTSYNNETLLYNN
ncbi:hypothetical protein HF086_009285, partial [Spodoptera exigua]